MQFILIVYSSAFVILPISSDGFVGGEGGQTLVLQTFGLTLTPYTSAENVFLSPPLVPSHIAPYLVCKWMTWIFDHLGRSYIPCGSGSSMEQPTVTRHIIFIVGVIQTQPKDWAVPEIVRSSLISAKAPRHVFDFVTCPRSQLWFTSR